MPLIKGSVGTSFLLIYCQLRYTLSSVTQCQEATYSIPNRVLTGHGFATRPSTTMESCVIFCAEDPMCKSINYFRKRKICELNNSSAVMSPESMVDSELSIYMTNAFSACHLDVECGGPEEICQLLESGGECKACKEALGLENGRISDSAFSASSVERHDTSPSRVRLNSDTAWSARTDDNMPWVQVDLGKDAMIKKIATQGRRGSSLHTKTYTVSSRADGETDFVMYREDNVVKVRQVLAFELSF
ncbi:Coagulation factor V [Stylophora pistillata]|uniref:Coagulation factor V n=1 Tax=Stylophora pistillata TaxID=50429 RepID=A0A2B4R7I8_STYPI|nr:Coagulation factor V [Stylophora pistillata]